MKEFKISIPKGVYAQIIKNEVIFKEIITCDNGIVDVCETEETAFQIYIEYPEIKVKKRDINKLGIGWDIPSKKQAEIIEKYHSTIVDVSGIFIPYNFWIIDENETKDFPTAYECFGRKVTNWYRDVEQPVVWVRPLILNKENELC